MNPFPTMSREAPAVAAFPLPVEVPFTEVFRSMVMKPSDATKPQLLLTWWNSKADKKWVKDNRIPWALNELQPIVEDIILRSKPSSYPNPPDEKVYKQLVAKLQILKKVMDAAEGATQDPGERSASSSVVAICDTLIKLANGASGEMSANLKTRFKQYGYKV